MRFDLVDLQLFVAVAEARSITHGAAGANLALPSASARIKGLEQALGTGLFKRGRRGVALTAAGESLLGHARIVLHDVAVLRGDLAGYARGLKASVHLLANTAGLAEHLPGILAAFLRENPHINVDVEERESPDIAQAIAAGAADIGLAIDLLCRRRCCGLRFATTVWCWWCHPTMNWPAGVRSALPTCWTGISSALMVLPPCRRIWRRRRRGWDRGCGFAPD